MAAPWLSENLCEKIKNDPEFMEKCSKISEDIQAGRLELVTLVEHLKDLLTHYDPTQRARGVEVLSKILQDLPKDFLPSNALEFIATFYCNRLKDHHDVLPAVFIGILAICQMSNLPKDVPSRLISTMFLNITCQSQQHADRYVIYQTLDVVINNRLNDVIGLGPDLVFNVISAMDGERDPRNLMLLFSILPSILSHLPLGHLTEEAFEVIACYFPVDFSPSADDHGTITREDLASALAPCLTAVPQFAEFCIPLLLEKLDSVLKLAKLDSLHLLEEACKRFSSADLSVHLSPLWMSLSREALPGTDLEIRQAAQSALKALLHQLATSPVDSEKRFDPMRILLSDVISAASTTLKQVQTNLFLPAVHLLIAAAESCSAACQIVFIKVIPLLSSYFLETDEVIEKVVLLSTISLLVSTCQIKEVTPLYIPELHAQWKALLPLYLDASKHPDSALRKEAVHGFLLLAPSLDVLGRSELYELLCLIVDSEENEAVRRECHECLFNMAMLHPSEVMKSVLHGTLSLPVCGEGGNGSIDSAKLLENRLAAQCHLAALDPFTPHIVPHVLDLVMSEGSVEKTTAGLKSLRTLFQEIEDAADQKEHVHKFIQCECSAIPRLLDWWLTGTKEKKPLGLFHNDTVLQDIAHVIALVMRNQTTNIQEELVSQTIPRFLAETSDFQPMSPTSPPHHTQTIALLEAVVGQAQSCVPVPHLHLLCHSLAHLAIHSSHPNTRLYSSRLSASLINKAGQDDVSVILTDLASMIDSSLESSEEIPSVQATFLLGWLTKGLVLRGYSDMDTWIQKVVLILFTGLISHKPSVGLEAAYAFRLIMEDSAVFLSAHSHCLVKLLYKQRFFQTSSTLINAFSNASFEAQSNILLALAYLLQGVPHTVLASNLGLILPVLLECLAQRQGVLLLAALDTLETLLPQTMHLEYLIPHTQSIIPRLLPLTCFKESMKVRISALKCLYQICKFPITQLLPFKYQVISALSVCLDDTKRLVRKEAVRTRTRWILLDAPGTEGKHS